MLEGRKFSESVTRHVARTAEGREVEILERRTFEQQQREDGSWSEPRQIHQRFDLRTGERVKHVEGDRFELDLTGEALTRVPGEGGDAQA